jgi:hypothetical protein
VEHVSVMGVISILYYLITAFLLGLLAWNFWSGKEDRPTRLLYLLVMVPLLLRLLRFK